MSCLTKGEMLALKELIDWQRKEIAEMRISENWLRETIKSRDKEIDDLTADRDHWRGLYELK